MNTKRSIFTRAVASSETTSFGVHEWNKIWHYTNIFILFFMLLLAILKLLPTLCQKLFFFFSKPFSVNLVLLNVFRGYNMAKNIVLYLENETKSYLKQ